MPSVNITERDFSMIASAAIDAQDRGDTDAAAALDKLARKMNAALSSAKMTREFGRALGFQKSDVRWQDMPSVLTNDGKP